jgi:shikimate kinase
LALARRLGVAFLDLDEQQGPRGRTTAYLNAKGYHAYAERNVRAYLEARAGLQEDAVIALSSGFMTYNPDVHAAYAELRAQVAGSPATFVLHPSLDYEVCVGETVRRPVSRPFSRLAEREEEVIRQRFSQYRQLSATMVETRQPVDAVVEGLLGHLQQTIQSRLQ